MIVRIPGVAAMPLLLAAMAQADAQPLRPATPVMLRASGTDPCSLAEVAGLSASGDGYLSVRTAPSASSRELDRLVNGQRVFQCSARGDWLGIVFDGTADGAACGVSSPVARTRRYTGPCRSGWVHQRWVQVIAG